MCGSQWMSSLEGNRSILLAFLILSLLAVIDIQDPYLPNDCVPRGLHQVGSRWRNMSRSAGGAALLESWGYGGEAEEIEEKILRLASAYLGSDSD